MKRIGAFASIGILLALAEIAGAATHRSVHALESALNAALEDDDPITLVEGTDFESLPGTVIFVSRNEGRRRMIAIARAGDPELCMLFIPSWEAWITVTTVRRMDEAWSESKYTQAVLALQRGSEFWHTHNNLPDPEHAPRDAEEVRQQALWWTMPWISDLHQIYDFEHDMPFVRFRGVVAHIYGTTTYFRDENLSEEWAQPIYIRFALGKEAENLRIKAGNNTSLQDLKEFAATYRGIIRLSFERVR